MLFRNLSSAIIILVCGAPFAQAQRDLRDIPTPDPAAERAAMRVADGFEVNLFASDPMFAKPVHMNFDAQGRLWIASSRKYPQIEPGATPSDQVIVVEDSDHDGVADRHQVFADNLLIPTGVLPGDGGVYVANSTELIHLTDTDGDGRADQRRTILSGFGTEDTHHLLHTLRWAPDGWMHLNQSIYIHSHVETPHGVQRLDGGGIWRFDPGTSQLEIFCKGFVNPWGHVIDAYGQSLVTDGAYFEGINYAFPEAVFVTSPGATRWLTGLNPGSPKHCGLEMISGDAMPKEMQGRLVTNDFRSHRVCLFEIARQGSGYRSAQLPELIRTEHVAFRPIDVKMGPDGAIYVADWYNPIIQHGEVDFRDPRRDTEHGRIWRISAKGKRPLTPPRYDRLSEPGLCQLLRDSALWVRQFARMELAARAKSKRDPALDDFVASAKSPEERSLRQLEQLWVTLCAREINSDLIDRLRKDDEPRVRALAVRIVSRLRGELPKAIDWLTDATTDSDDQVVLEAVTGLGQMQTLAGVNSLLNVAARPSQDQFLKFALWNAVRSTESIWLDALQNNKLPVRDDLPKLRLLADAATQSDIARPLFDLLRGGELAEVTKGSVVDLIAEKAAPDGLGELLDWSLAPGSNLPLTSSGSYLESLVRITQSRNLKPERCEKLVEQSLIRQLAVRVSGEEATLSSQFVATLVDAVGAWQCDSSAATVIEWLERSEQAAAPALNARGLQALGRLSSPVARGYVRRQSTSATQAAQRAAALNALNNFDSAAAAQGTLNLLRSLPPNDWSAGESAATGLVSRAAGIEALRQALDRAGEEPWSADGARVLIAAVRNAAAGDESLLAKVLSVTRFDALGWKWSEAWSKEIIEKAMTRGDAARGEVVYRDTKLQCVRCHAIGPSGSAIGPNLVSLGGSSPPEYILQSLIEPNAKLKEGFQTLSVLTDDGRVISGLQKSRSDTQLQLLLADGNLQTIAADSIESVQNGRSLMPAGLVDMLKEQELVDLTRFLIELGKSPKYTLDTAPRVRNWSVLNNTPEAALKIKRTSSDTVAIDLPELIWVSVPATVAGLLPVAEIPTFQAYKDLPTLGFARFDVEVQQAGSIKLELSAEGESVALWLDGRPRRLPAPDETIQLETGHHRLVFALRVRDVNPGFSCQVRTGHLGSAVIQLGAK